MTDATREVPPIRVAAAALRETTERLASEVVEPTDAVPEWSDLYWAVAQAAAAIQGVSALLCARSHWAGPRSWLSFLQTQRRHSSLRDQKIGRLLEQIETVTRNARIGVVALKGAALRSLRVHDHGERPMADIDLLVRPADLQLLQRALGQLNYRLAHNGARHAVFLPAHESVVHGFGEHERNVVPIEVHTTVAENMPVRRVDITDSLWPTNLHDGINSYASHAALMLHLLLHSSGNIRKRAIRQIQLHDIASLSRHLDRSHWDDILSSRDGGQPRWWLYPPLAVTAQYYSDSIPADTLREARSLCPPVLRMLTHRARLADISFSNPRIPAFPGIGWSRTPLEALRFMRARIAPGRAALDGLRNSVDA
ncbi:MAG TPA: nucleotidyltransferase family protein, partial [Gammaproteobacteria bacterium]|nr:nucleotidyltransferase family protein [Gammaproteobacteria bacterium]